jgi:hypothetical protein
MSDGERNIPTNELDLTFSMTEPVWGKEVNEDLDKLNEIKKTRQNAAGNNEETITKMMSLFDYYKRDLRLANLTVGEYNRAQEWLNHAGRCLRFSIKGTPMLRAFNDALMVVATTTELSQSKQGFFRKRFNTFTNENNNSIVEPKKRNMFGGNKNNNNGGGY